MLLKLLFVVALIIIIPRILSLLFEFFELNYTIYGPYVMWILSIILFVALLSKKSIF